MDGSRQNRASVSTTTLGPLSSRIVRSSAVSHELASPRPQKPSAEELCSKQNRKPHRWPAPCEDVRLPKIKTSTPTKKKPEDDDEEKKEPPLTPSQRKRSEEEIILSAPASAQSAKSKESPEKEPKSKKQKRQSEKLKCISSPKPIGI